MVLRFKLQVMRCFNKKMKFAVSFNQYFYKINQGVQIHNFRNHVVKDIKKILTKDIQAAKSKILTNKSSNCSITSSSKVFPANE